ncbi:hypothetical protein ZWY2020_054693 [Hordeum vulgare]|nr:hypothetical protein ZWY2020_054693 [Hordeum vulgare]
MHPSSPWSPGASPPSASASTLAHVLRHLPAQEVVQRCLLARRWRGLWRSVPTLRFTWAKGSGSANRIAQFVYRLLHLRCGGDDAPLESCDFDFDSDGFILLPLFC